MKQKIRSLLVFAVAGVAAGQQGTKDAQKSPSVRVQRTPAARPAKQEGVPDPAKYPFDRLINTLDSGDPVVSHTSVGAVSALAPGNPASEVPYDFRPAKDVPLPPAAKEALSVGQAWMTENHTPAPGKDGRVLYTYGAGLPTLVCAPLRVCVVELEAGEKLVGEPQIGDSVRWIISPATSGSGDLSTSMIVVKPKQAGLDTNLLVTTDRRAYYVRLISKPEDYLARIAFAYPENESLKWKARLAEDQRRRREESEAVKVAPVESLENLYFDYRIQGGDENMRPIRVVDDGKKTFIQMTPNAAHREAPVLVVLGTDGPEMVNYRVKGDMYIVDRLFDRGALILGVGKKTRRAEIIRGTYRGKVSSKEDPYSKALEEKAR
jgi:P-type conjugative transfer protein TrbG